MVAKEGSEDPRLDEPPDESGVQFTVNDDGTMSVS